MEAPRRDTNTVRDNGMQDRMDEFERQNPKVAEAMRLFGLSLAQYHGALNAMRGVRITQGNSTKPSPNAPTTRG